MSLVERVRDAIRNVPDFPKPGIQFKDISTLLLDPKLTQEVIDWVTETYRDLQVDRVLGMESRGFIFGQPVALALEAGFVLARKPGKLPAETVSVSYDLEYGSATLEVHKDAIQPGQRVLVVDDLLATGGTAEAAIQLIRELGGEPVGFFTLIELDFLKGRDRLDVPVLSLVNY